MPVSKAEANNLRFAGFCSGAKWQLEKACKMFWSARGAVELAAVVKETKNPLAFLAGLNYVAETDEEREMVRKVSLEILTAAIESK